SLTASVESGAVLVRIEDSGIGFQGRTEPRVGLTLVRGILALHQGSPELRTADSGTGTQAAVRVPFASGGPVPGWKRLRDGPAPHGRGGVRSSPDQARRSADAERAARGSREEVNL